MIIGIEPLALLGLLSVVTFFGSLIAVPVIINRMPPDYFTHHWERLAKKQSSHPVIALSIMVLRNIIGVLLLFAGVAMLVLPGQGILTIIIGCCVMNFPKKQQILRRIIKEKKVQQALNWIRRKGGKADFEFY